MSDLTSERDAWIERVLGVKLVGDRGANRVAAQHEVVQQLTGLGPPPGATDDEIKTIRARLGAARSLLDDQATAPELKQARAEIEVAKGLIEAAKERIAHEKERREQGATLLEQARAAAKTIDADASAAEGQAVAQAVQTIDGLVAKDLSAQQITEARQVLTQLEAKLKSLAEAGTLLRQQRAKRAEEILAAATATPKKIDPDAIEGDRTAINTAVSALGRLLVDPVSAGALTQAETDLLALTRLLETIAERCESDRARRRKAAIGLADRIKACLPVAKATEGENKALAATAEPATNLSATPTDTQLEAAGTAAFDVEKQAAELKLLIGKRQERVDEAAKLGLRLAETAPSLKLHDRAPADDAESLQKAVGEQRKLVTGYADWALVTTWDGDALVALDKAITELEERATSINKATADRITKVTEAAQRATAAITGASPRAFSGGQQTELLKAVKVETDKFAANITAADGVVTGLNTLTNQAVSLALALTGLARLLGAVAVVDAGKLSPKEKAALEKAKTNAETALDEVTEA